MKKSEIYLSLKNKIEGEIFCDDETLKFYSVDSSLYQVIPQFVIIPRSEEDVIKVVRFAYRNKIPVTVRGAGTGLVGNALNSGIILDLKNLKSINITKKFAKVQPGILKGDLDKALKNQRKFFPPNPSIGPFCSIGGIIGNNASGSRTLKYGSAIDNIEQITFVNGIGKKITLPKEKKLGGKILQFSKKINLNKYPKTSKNSCGYRLDSINSINETHKILAGSEGTLGIILSAKIKIRNLPKKMVLFILEYSSLQRAAKNCLGIKETNPSAIEFVDKKTLKNFKFEFNKNTQCLLFVEYDHDLKFNEKRIRKIADTNSVKKISKEREIQKWWRLRDNALSFSLKSTSPHERIPHIIEDAAVPLEKLGTLFSIIEKINKKFKTKTVMYGHAGNGNIHVRIISNKKKIKSLEKIAGEYFKQIIQMGGTITAEHGDGIARSNFVELQYGKNNYKIFKELKKIFDPKGILNPGKITSYSDNLKILEI